MNGCEVLASIRYHNERCEVKDVLERGKASEERCAGKG